MQFRHPELLYALFLLIIPILVHLFQLRKFKKEYFTNVDFLKRVNIQTRKSNTIKKWLVLLSRLLALAMIVLAFAQPFYTNNDSATKAKETVIYLDNSFSMQAKGSRGPLLTQSVQDLIVNIPEEQRFTLFTNTQTYKDISIKGSRKELLQIPYTAAQLPQEAIAFKAQKEFSDDPSTDKRFIAISDFQDKGESPLKKNDNYSSYLVHLTPEITKNIAIDSVYISGRQIQGLELTVALTSGEREETNTPVSLFNGETLIAKATASFEEGLETTVVFSLENPEITDGKIMINDAYLNFDNSLFFNLNTNNPIKVLSINETDDRYLARVYRNPEFAFSSVAIDKLDFSTINNFNLVILNEVAKPSAALSNALGAFSSNGGSILVIPNQGSSASDYNGLLGKLGGIQFGEEISKDRLVTTINYDHPLYKNVFENRIKNFQYPTVNSGYKLLNGDALLSFEDGSAFVANSLNTYVFAGAIISENSNFKNSPLIVPTLYNLGKESLALPQLYFNTTTTNTFDVPIRLKSDAILTLSEAGSSNNTFIPLQQTLGTKARITTSELPEKAGVYTIKLKDSLVQQVSYNYDRSESLLRYQKLNPQEGITYNTSVVNLFQELKEADTVDALWKWFVIFALGFLVIEMLILKFFK